MEIKKQFAGYASPTVVRLLQENPEFATTVATAVTTRWLQVFNMHAEVLLNKGK